MSLNISVTSIVQGAVDTPGHLVSVSFNGNFNSGGFTPPNWGDSGDQGAQPRMGFEWGYQSVLENQGPIESASSLFGFPRCDDNSGDFEYTPGNGYTGMVLQSKLVTDRDHLVGPKGQGFDLCDWGTLLRTIRAAPTAFRTKALTATVGTPASSAITQTGATINCDYTPNTDASTATVKLEYRKQGESIWIQAGSPVVSAGYSLLNISRVISSLQCGITYEFRLNMTRTTVNDQTLTSSIATFVTSACGAPSNPSVTTFAATNVSFFTATLNGRVNPNGTSTNHRFEWGLVQGGPYPSLTADIGPVAGDADIDYSANLTGLNPGTTYYYRARATTAGGTFFGLESTFTTLAFTPIPGVPTDEFRKTRDKPVIYDVKSTIDDELRIEGVIAGLKSGKLNFNRSIGKFEKYLNNTITIVIGMFDAMLIPIPLNARYVLITTPLSAGIPPGTVTSPSVEFVLKGGTGDLGVRMRMQRGRDTFLLLPVSSRLQATFAIGNPTLSSITLVATFF